MLRDPSFWSEEAEAPLLRRNAGYFTETSCPRVTSKATEWIRIVCPDLTDARKISIREKLAQFATGCTSTSPAGVVSQEEMNGAEDETVEALWRIFRLDAERTFTSPERRNTMVATLKCITAESRDYHQGLGYIVSFLLLLLPPEDVVAIATSLQSDPKYMPGYFYAAPTAFVRDAKVFHFFTKQRHPDLADHLRSMVVPEAYASKWLVGCNVHVLPFVALMRYFENFFNEGIMYAFKFTQGMMDVLDKALKAENRVDRLFALLRLDKSIFPDKVETAEALENAISSPSHQAGPRVAAAPRTQRGDESAEATSSSSAQDGENGHSNQNPSGDSFFLYLLDAADSVSFSESELRDWRDAADRELAEEFARRKRREEEMKKLEDDDDEIRFSDEED